ncbi:N2,N2-dimethylguanosine tRNA methyltransferase [Synechococcus sp. PCC 7335]|uniref:N2,N2-dimethylguanosine tRNA methyltransferase n=1 Tax=Synechococcus sp. (strain ATCC 29403 / PCC 7335) TaxID=91464 RepID=UPI00017EB7F6|nr:N2,N2-dimethylguanosine tRNA methyltransferase [Synechococcus sp. PCC 7335]EDX86945.1 N2,N2-dimethylguanosine tRNA methyltransferase [Synechococcus sp. PCC 7335]
MHHPNPDWQTEGVACFSTAGAFFRASSKTGRDLAILAALAQKHHRTNLDGQLRIIDAMTGCGVRAVRYLLEAEADYVWANEGNRELNKLIWLNLQANLDSRLCTDRYRLTHQDANAVFFEAYQRQDFYDLVDIDSFGSPMPVLSTSLWAVKLGGLLYLTSTDGRATSGHALDSSLQSYSAYARAHPAVHEQGLRLLIGLAVQQAAARGLGAWPVFSWYHAQVNRVMMRITRASTWQRDRYGFLTYCHTCGQFGRLGWKQLQKGTACVCQSVNPPVVSGPMWLGPLHNLDDLAAMHHIAGQKNWPDHLALIEIMQSEANLPPYFYPLAEIGRRAQIDIPPRQSLIDSIKDAGFRASETHLSAQAIKTEAPLSICLDLARQLS